MYGNQINSINKRCDTKQQEFIGILYGYSWSYYLGLVD